MKLTKKIGSISVILVVTLMLIASWQMVEVEARNVDLGGRFSSINGDSAGGRLSVEPERGQIGIKCTVDPDCLPFQHCKCVQGMCKC